jgi:hypothetical protein
VDVVWQMTAKEGGAFTLAAKKRRMGWVPLTVDIVMTETDTMRFDLLHGHTWPAGTAEVAAILDELGVDTTASARVVSAAYREAGHKAASDALRAAQKYRKERSSTIHFATDSVHAVRGKAATERAASVPNGIRHTPAETGSGTPSGTPTPETAKPQVDAIRHTSRHTPAHPSDATAARCVSLSGAHPPGVTNADQSQPTDRPYADPNVF